MTRTWKKPYSQSTKPTARRLSCRFTFLCNVAIFTVHFIEVCPSRPLMNIHTSDVTPRIKQKRSTWWTLKSRHHHCCFKCMFKELMSLLTRSWQSQPLTCKNCKSPRSCVQSHRVKEDYSLMGSSIMWLTASSSTDTHPGRTCTAWAPRWSPHIKSGPSGWWHSLGTVWPHSDTGLAGPGPTGGAPGIVQAEKELTYIASQLWSCCCI